MAEEERRPRGKGREMSWEQIDPQTIADKMRDENSSLISSVATMIAVSGRDALRDSYEEYWRGDRSLGIELINKNYAAVLLGVSLLALERSVYFQEAFDGEAFVREHNTYMIDMSDKQLTSEQLQKGAEFAVGDLRDLTEMQGFDSTYAQCFIEPDYMPDVLYNFLKPAWLAPVQAVIPNYEAVMENYYKYMKEKRAAALPRRGDLATHETARDIFDRMFTEEKPTSQ